MMTRLATFVALAGCALVLVGGVALLSPVTVLVGDARVVTCGTGFTTDREARDLDGVRALNDVATYGVALRRLTEDTVVERCGSALTTRRLWSWPLLGVGVLAALGALAVTFGGRHRRLASYS